MADDQAEENIHIEETDGGEELLTVGDEPRRTRGSLRWWASITALVGLVIGAGFLAGSLLGDDDGDASPDSDSADVETAGNDEAAADDGAADSTPSPDQAPGEATVQGAVANSSVSAVEGTGFTSFDHGPNWVVPWGDGFLWVGIEYGSPSLPEFPEEWAALSPDEVREIVSGSGATTIEDAQAALIEADLIDEVMAVLEENPEVMASLSGPSEATLTLATSTDGITWEARDPELLPFAAEGINSVTSDGNHLVFATQNWNQVDATSSSSIHATTDLVTWESHVIPSPDLDLPEYASADSYVSSVAAGPTGLVAIVNEHVWADPSQFLPDDMKNLNGGWSVEETSTGLTVEVFGEPEIVYDESGNVDEEATEWDCCHQPVDEFTYTWEELGIDPDVYQSFNQGPGEATIWFAPWGGVLERSDLSATGWGGSLAATDSGFLATISGEDSAHMLFSVDGSSWSQAESPDAWLNGVSAVDGGVLAFGWSHATNESAVWLGDADGTNWRTVVVPDLPADAQMDFMGPPTGTLGFVSITDAAGYDDPFEGVEVGEITYEHEGFTITELNDHDEGVTTTAVRIVDPTGAVVLDEIHSVDWAEIEAAEDGHDVDPGIPPFIDLESEDGVGYIDPASGATILLVPWDVKNQAWEEAWDAALEEAGINPYTAHEYSPDLWLVATPNGIDWLVEDLPDPDPERGYWPGIAAINGDVVLVGSEGGLTRYQIG